MTDVLHGEGQGIVHFLRPEIDACTDAVVNLGDLSFVFVVLGQLHNNNNVFKLLSSFRGEIASKSRCGS